MKNLPDEILSNEKFSVNDEALSLIMNNLDDFFLLISKDLRIIGLNEATRKKICSLFSKNITLETSILELVPFQRHKELIKIYEAVFNGEERKTESAFEKNGEVTYFENHFKPAKNRHGEIIAVLVSSRDTTNYKKAEATLKEIEERWRFALEGGSQGVWDWNVCTGEIFFSDSYKKLYGYGADDLIGRIEEWETIIHPDDRKRMSKAVEEHLSSSNPYYESIYRVKTKDGNYKWILGRGMLIRNEEGNPLRMIGTHTDISRQIIAEQTYKVLFYSNPLPMWTYDLETLQILDVNDAAIIHYGYSKQEFLSLTIKDLKPEEQVKDLLKFLEHRKTVDHQKRLGQHRKKNGEIIDVEVSTHKLDDSNKVLVVAQDITERKYAEKIWALERSVFELSNKPGIDFKFLAGTLLSGLEEIHNDAYTSLLLLKDDDTIKSLVAPRLPEEYSAAINEMKIGPNAGSCGTAMWRKETIIVEDIDSDPLWEQCKHFALQYGLQSCWSFPIIHTSGKVMGSFAIYYKKVKSPSSVEMNTLERVRNILRILMEHHWSLDEIKKANERFDIVMEATHDLIWDWNLETNIIYRDAMGLQKVYGIAHNKSIESIELWLSHIHPDDLDRVRKAVVDILESKEENIFDVEYRFKRDDGIYSYVYDRGMILRNEEGKPVRMIGAAQNITERKYLEEELLRNELEKQKAINQATVDSQELERTEIGKELHDNVNQILTTTKLYLDLALSNSELKNELIEKSNKNIISVINEIRQLSRSLMDPTIGDLGLIDSINDLIENINLTRRLHVSLVADKELELLLDKRYKLTIFRIIQEALNNAMKYAKASTVVICFKLHGNNMIVTIQDDGIGFEPALVKMGAGLKNIQNRIYLMSGTYRIESSPKQGCKIVINFPIIKTTDSE